MTGTGDGTAVPGPPPGPTGPPIGILIGTDRSYSVDIIVCAVITNLIGTIFVGLRFYARGKLMRVLAIEDYLILIAQIFSIATAVSTIQQAVLGLGKHWWLIDLASLMPMSKAGWYNILFYELSLWFSQTSILVLYLRIWTYPWVRRCTWALIGIIFAYNTFVFISIFTACIPLEAFWNFGVTGYCHAKSVWWANTYLHIGTDFLIYLLPMPIIFRLRFPRRQKALLFMLFAFGFFVCFISIIRLVYLIITEDTTDFAYDNTTIAFWTTVETNATVAIACFMTMKPLLAKWFPNLVSTSNSGEAMSPGQDSPAGPDANGRVPTIGSSPMRGTPGEKWMPRGFTFSRLGSSSGAMAEDDERDLEAAELPDNNSGSLEKVGPTFVTLEESRP